MSVIKVNDDWAPTEAGPEPVIGPDTGEDEWDAWHDKAVSILERKNGHRYLRIEATPKDTDVFLDGRGVVVRKRVVEDDGWGEPLEQWVAEYTEHLGQSVDRHIVLMPTGSDTPFEASLYPPLRHVTQDDMPLIRKFVTWTQRAQNGRGMGDMVVCDSYDEAAQVMAGWNSEDQS